jgi:hypothetical protein
VLPTWAAFPLTERRLDAHAAAGRAIGRAAALLRRAAAGLGLALSHRHFQIDPVDDGLRHRGEASLVGAVRRIPEKLDQPLALPVELLDQDIEALRRILRLLDQLLELAVEFRGFRERLLDLLIGHHGRLLVDSG